MIQSAKIIGSGLATIGLTNILLSLLTINKELLLSEVIYTHLAKKAIYTIDKMIISLPENSLLLEFLKVEIAKSALKINGVVSNNIIEIRYFLDLSLKKKDKDKELNKILNLYFLIAGVYIFIAPDDSRYLGSCINFKERLSEHKDQFSNKRKPTVMHLYKYKYVEYKWSPLYLTLNYSNIFQNKHPNYSLSQGEHDILMAITQLLPRILEQSLLSNYSFSLNGKDKLVKFSYTNWNSEILNLPLIKDKRSKLVDIIINEKVVKTVNSINELLPVLGIQSRNTVKRYMNHVRGFYSPTYKEFVNIKYPHISNLSTHEIVFRTYKEKPELVIPNIPLFSLELNKLFVYTENLFLIYTFDSIKKAVRYLNPNHKELGINLRGKEIAISRAKNKQMLVVNEIGSFYFAENPNSNRWEGYQKSKYPLILKDVTTNINIPFDSIKRIQEDFLTILGIKPDTRTILKHFHKKTIYRKKYLFVLK